MTIAAIMITEAVAAVAQLVVEMTVMQVQSEFAKNSLSYARRKGLIGHRVDSESKRPESCPGFNKVLC